MIPNIKGMVGKGSLVFAQNVKINQLTKAGRIGEAIQIFNSMETRNTVTYNSMISGYAKNGQIAKARCLFNQMPFKNLVSWNTMIAGYSHNGCVSEAYELFEKMPKRDLFSWTIMVTCYAQSGNLEKARCFFDQMPGEKSSVCYNAMISGYAKNKRFEEAIDLLEAMPTKDFVSWNSVLVGYTQNEEMTKAFRFFKQMPERDSVSWNLMIEGFVRIREMEAALDIFKQMPSPNIVSWVTVLNGYCRNAQLLKARLIFDTMPERNVVAWNAMLAGYVQYFEIEEAYRLFVEMPEKNSVSWTTMIDGFVHIGKINDARELLDKMPFDNVAAQTAMINGYVQCQRMDDANDIFKKMKNPDSICCNTMISGYAQFGRMDQAMKLFKWMTYKDIVSWNTVISGFAQDGQLQKATELFHQMAQKNTVSWNSIISGFTQNCLYTEALEYFLIMRKQEAEPDCATFACCLSACANLATLPIGRQIHDLLLKYGFGNDSFACNSLLIMYAKCGMMPRARQVFDEMVNIDLISWNSLIAGYSFNGQGKDAVLLFQDMEKNRIKPDEATYASLLSACCHSGMVNEGLDYFYTMTTNYSIAPVPEHFACVVDLLGRAGRLEEAFALARQMPVKATAGIWGALLGACRLHKNTELAEFAAKMLMEFEPHKAANYIVLSNTHAEAGGWDEVERLRVLMKQRGVQKQTGLSWIEVGKKVCTFSSDDSKQPRTTEVCKILAILSTQMKDAGLSSMPLLDHE